MGMDGIRSKFGGGEPNLGGAEDTDQGEEAEEFGFHSRLGVIAGGVKESQQAFGMFLALNLAIAISSS